MKGVLLVLTLLVVLNPARAVLRAEPGVLGVTPADRLRRAAMAAGAAVVVGALLTALAHPLLDAFDISPAMFRIPAGAVMTLSGFAALLVVPRPWGPWDERPGPADVAVPLTLPVLVHPTLLVAVVTWGADRGVLVTTVGILLAASVFVALARLGPGSGRGGKLLVVGRLTGAVTAVIGISHGVHGVLGV